MALRPSGEFVHTLSYEHKHGTDLTVYDSEEAAIESAQEIMRENVDDWEDKEAEYLKMKDLIENNPIEAMNEWSDYSVSEYMTVESKEIWTSKTNIDSLREAIDDAEHESG